VRKWLVDNGTSSPYQNCVKGRKKDRELAGVTEAARRAGVSTDTLYNWVRTGLLRPAADLVPNGRGRPGQVFDVDEVLEVAKQRNAIESPSSEGIVSSGEAVRLVGVTRQTLLNWEAQGLLAPVGEALPSKRGRPGRRYRLAELLALAEDRGVVARTAEGLVSVRTGEVLPVEV
jgi:hypothetical protein